MQLPYTIAIVIDTFNSPLLTLGLILASAGFVCILSRDHATALIVSSLCAGTIGYILKLLFAIPRLDSALVVVTGYRFPSLHAVIATAFFGSLCFSAFYLIDSLPLKILIVLLACVAIVLVAWSRVFLHAHLPIDVIVGSLLGISITFLVHVFLLHTHHGL